MHELSVMSEAVRIAVETVKSSGAKRVTGLKIRVGTLSGAAPDAMRFAWSSACRDTIAEGAWLEIETVHPICWCDKCQREFACEDFFNECPACGEPSGDLRRGGELEVAGVEMS